MPDRITTLKQRDRVLTIILGTIVVGAIGFLSLMAAIIYTSHEQAVEGNEAGYKTSLDIWQYAYPACARGILDRVDSIEGDQRNQRFFEAAAVARRAAGTKLDLSTARKYEHYSRQSGDAAQRRMVRLLGANFQIVRLKVPGPNGRPVPAPAAQKEADRVCLRANPRPVRPKDPAYISVDF